MTDKPWAGRFTQKTDGRVEAFTSSVDVDSRLYKSDIQGSIAHCRMLARQGIISQDDADAIVKGLGEIEKDIESGRFVFDPALEDVHMNIENALYERIGPAARKLHTARSRNDQVALDTRLYLGDETVSLIRRLVCLRRAIVNFANDHMHVVMPGYTHLQRAQPVLFAHHMMAYYEMFSRDTQRFRECLARINVMPLGSAALAGAPYPLDREYTASLLGFDDISANSMDAVSDRDFAIEFLAAASICMVHFSRLSEELVLWSSSEFGFIELSDSFSTGSSIMPQKKNPDVPELVRGKAGRVIGDLVALLVTMKALPLCYNRDMQEDKPVLFDAVDTLRACIDIYTAMFPNIKVNDTVTRDAALRGFLNATDMADYLVGKGVPFRDAHACVGRAVAFAAKNGRELHELSLEEIQRFAPEADDDLFGLLTPESVIDRRNVAGGTGRERVMEAIEAARRQLSDEEKSDAK
ncbi:MAG: argininosuccinate lyase [Desulfococcus sp. 4484_241]|nr:MAG: argininosuccinate lyase [Desulfococcus sp. 4484_241]